MTDPLMQTIAKPSSKKAARPSKPPRVHPIFSRENFASDLDYDNVFFRPALLASRLLTPQQSYHWLDATWFGPRGPCHLPTAYDNEPKTIPVPMHYTSNFAVGSLSRAAKKAVEEQLIGLSDRIAFGVCPDMKPGLIAFTRLEAQEEGERGVASAIWINAKLYEAIRRECTPSRRAMLELDLAITLLHEFAHAACFHVKGHHPEDFFEDSLVAEAGFEYESRIFGASLSVLSYDSPDKACWKDWQTKRFLIPAGYSLTKKCRDEINLPMGGRSVPVDSEYAQMLFNDNFWKRDRSFDVVPTVLRQEKHRWLFDAAPMSFRTWYLDHESALQKKKKKKNNREKARKAKRAASQSMIRSRTVGLHRGVRERSAMGIAFARHGLRASRRALGAAFAAAITAAAAAASITHASSLHARATRSRSKVGSLRKR